MPRKKADVGGPQDRSLLSQAETKMLAVVCSLMGDVPAVDFKRVAEYCGMKHGKNARSSCKKLFNKIKASHPDAMSIKPDAKGLASGEAAGADDALVADDAPEVGHGYPYNDEDPPMIQYLRPAKTSQSAGKKTVGKSVAPKKARVPKKAPKKAPVKKGIAGKGDVKAAAMGKSAGTKIKEAVELMEDAGGNSPSPIRDVSWLPAESTYDDGDALAPGLGQVFYETPLAPGLGQFVYETPFATAGSSIVGGSVYQSLMESIEHNDEEEAPSDDRTISVIDPDETLSEVDYDADIDRSDAASEAAHSDTASEYAQHWGPSEGIRAPPPSEGYLSTPQSDIALSDGVPEGIYIKSESGISDAMSYLSDAPSESKLGDAHSEADHNTSGAPSASFDALALSQLVAEAPSSEVAISPVEEEPLTVKTSVALATLNYVMAQSFQMDINGYTYEYCNQDVIDAQIRGLPIQEWILRYSY